MENPPSSSRRHFIKQAAVAAGSGAIALSGVGALAVESKKTIENASSDAAATADAKSETFDYVVVGGGLAGCAVAARMSEDPGVRVVLLEAGKENLYENSYYSTGAQSMWEGETNWHFASTPQKELGGRAIDHPRGKLIGGSAALNVGSWSRGIPADYDAWEKAGATGWGWPAALAIYQRMEASKRPPDETRGRSGPVILEDTPVVSDMTGLMREACIAAGFGITADHNGKKVEGFDMWETIFPGGRRRNSAESHLAVARSRPNLRVITGVMATRVAIEGGRAVGVELEVGGKRRRVLASKEVLLCAGALMSPKLLMLSGVGPADHLRKHGIKVVADLPGVGANLVDHLFASIGGVAASGGIQHVQPNPKDPKQLETWRRTGYGPLADTPYTSIAFLRSTPDKAEVDIELVFNVNPPKGLSDDPRASGYTILVAYLQPKSRGTLRLASSDPHAPPVIDFGYLSHPDDLPTMVAGVRRAMALAATAPLASYAAKQNYNPKATDAELSEWIRSAAGTMFHPVGTARMGAENDPAAVLDPQLRVRGVKGLRVVDASAMPEINRGHTMAPTLYIAERGCELIRGKAAAEEFPAPDGFDDQVTNTL